MSFGTTSILAIGAVMIIATLTAKDSGRKVKNEARQSLSTQVTDNLGASSRYVAEIISRKLFDNLGGAAAILEEGIRDRVSLTNPPMASYSSGKYSQLRLFIISLITDCWISQYARICR